MSSSGLAIGTKPKKKTIQHQPNSLLQKQYSLKNKIISRLLLILLSNRRQIPANLQITVIIIINNITMVKNMNTLCASSYLKIFFFVYHPNMIKLHHNAR